MSAAASVLMLAGGAIALLAGAGVLRFSTPYARFHSAGKASPTAFLVAAAGACIELGARGAVMLAIAAVAMTLTLPLGVHLLFRAVNRTTDNDHLVVNDYDRAEAEGGGSANRSIDSSPPRHQGDTA